MSNVNQLGKYQPYPDYKDSGVEWLGEVPAHWCSTTIKYGFSVCLGKMLQKDAKNEAEKLKPYLKAQNIQPNGVNISVVEQMWFSLSEIRTLRLEKGDVLVSEGGDVGRSAIWNDELPECYIQNAINRVRPVKGNSSRFFLYWMSFLKGSSYIDVICNKATIAHYTAEKVEVSPLLLPDDNEQCTIAAFLDYETARIDQLIAKQKQLIELLKEKRQAVISHAVTKGLNPNAPMKDSGVEWLGQVPEHWVVGRYKFCCSRVIVGIAEAATHAYVDQGIPLVRSTNIKETGLDCGDMLYLEPKFAAQNITKKLKVHDVITVRTGYPGISAVIPEVLDGSQCFTNLVATPLPVHESEFLSTYLNSVMGKSYFDLNAWGSAQKNISVPILQNFPISWPSQQEQLELVSFCKKINDKFNRLIDVSMNGIKLLQERRTALISAAVTGKIDLRGWQPPKREVTE